MYDGHILQKQSKKGQTHGTNNAQHFYGLQKTLLPGHQKRKIRSLQKYWNKGSRKQKRSYSYYNSPDVDFLNFIQNLAQYLGIFIRPTGVLVRIKLIGFEYLYCKFKQAFQTLSFIFNMIFLIGKCSDTKKTKQQNHHKFKASTKLFVSTSAEITKESHSLLSLWPERLKNLSL